MYELCNLKFDESFYKGEEIDGFWVTGLMKRCWASQLEVLYVFDQICRRHNIDWYADWGTLLGTIRHKGFIPWDDDIDICMRRKDYDYVMSILPNELPREYRIMKPGSKEKLDNLMLRIVNSDGVNFNPSFTERYHGCPYVCGLDIFPLDTVPENEEEWEILKEIIRIILNADNQLKEISGIERDNLISQLEDMCGIILDRNGDIHQQLLLLVDALAISYQDDNSGYMINMWQYSLGSGKGVLRCDWYDEKIYLPFENIMMPVPKHYDEVLKTLFGDDYMTPIRGTSFHEYPFYSKQKKDARSKISAAPGYEKREEWVAHNLSMDVDEVFEYRIDGSNDDGDVYIYFCQSQLLRVVIPHELTL